MNSDVKHKEVSTAISDDELLLRKFLKKNAYEAQRNEWFTPRLVNKLPPASYAKGRCIMTAVTVLAVVFCFVVLCMVSENFLLSTENLFTLDLLCIYAAMMGAMTLVTLQIIRLIKTYF